MAGRAVGSPSAGQLGPGRRRLPRGDATAAAIEGFDDDERLARSGRARERDRDEGPCRFAWTSRAARRPASTSTSATIAPLVGGRAAGRRVLDAFAYTGAFACRPPGARPRALALDQLGPRLRAGRGASSPLNGLAGPRRAVAEANAFDALRGSSGDGRRFDLVVLDPPPSRGGGRRRRRRSAATRRSTCARSGCLQPGGLLARSPAPTT